MPYRRVSAALAITVAMTPHLLCAQADSTPRAFSSLLSFNGQIAGIAGGLGDGSAVLGLAGAQATLQLAPLIHWHGATVFADLLASFGGHPGAYAGDIQGVSNIDAPNGVRIEEAWLQQNLLDDRLSLLAGRFDVSAEFYRLQSAALFLNSSLGTGPEFAGSGVEGPSIYPFTSLGGRVAIKPSPNVVFRAALLDGVPVSRPGGSRIFAAGDGVLVLGELALLQRPEPVDVNRQRRFHVGRGTRHPYTGKIALGGWYYTASFDRLVAPGLPSESVDGSGGIYLIADLDLYVDSAAKRGPLTGFVQLGLGDGRVNHVGAYIGAGLTLTSPVARRSGDELGLAVAMAFNGEAFKRLPAAVTGETTIECTYLAQVLPWLAAQPDVQYVIHPGGTSRTPNALVVSLTIALSH
jgi:porin